MAITVIDPEESRNRLIGQISTNLTNAAELQMRRQQMLQEAKRAERDYMLDRARTAVQVQTNRREQRKAGTDLQLDVATKLAMKPAKRSELLGMSPQSRMEALKQAQSFGGQKFVPDQRLADLKKASGRGGMQRYIQNEDGSFEPVPGILVETPNQRLERKTGAATADQKNQLQANQGAAIVFGELQRLSKGLEEIGGYQGIAIKGGNIVTRGALNPEAQAYKDFMPAAGVSLYRGITGDTRLSDADAASRAYPLVWDIDQDGSVKGIKEKNVQNLLSARNILLSNNIYSTSKKDKITSLEDVMFVSNAVNQGATEEEIIGFLKKKKRAK